MIEHKGYKFRALAYIPLHYGADFLIPACRAVLPAVDEIIILYSKKPSYGHAASLPIPEREEEHNLFKLFKSLRDYPEAAGKILSWKEVNEKKEHLHRMHGVNYGVSKNYDLVMTFDSDEIWETNSLLDCLVEALNGSASHYHTNHEGWRHYYRNFNEYCTDGFEPVRLFNLHNYGHRLGRVTANKIYHLGYAVKEDIMQYKLSCHGHKAEMNVEEFFEFWKNYDKESWELKQRTETDNTLHPVSRQVWYSTTVDEEKKLIKLLEKYAS